LCSRQHPIRMKHTCFRPGPPVPGSRWPESHEGRRQDGDESISIRIAGVAALGTRSFAASYLDSGESERTAIVPLSFSPVTVTRMETFFAPLRTKAAAFAFPFGSSLIVDQSCSTTANVLVFAVGRHDSTWPSMSRSTDEVSFALWFCIAASKHRESTRTPDHVCANIVIDVKQSGIIRCLMAQVSTKTDFAPYLARVLQTTIGSCRESPKSRTQVY
jgi:hypothetical protein